MAKIAPYLIGGLTAFLVADFVPLPSPSEQLGALRASVAAPAPLLGTPASSVNRAAKGNREMLGAPPAVSFDMVFNNLPLHSNGVVRTLSTDDAQPANPKPPTQRRIKVPLGCESSFSQVAAPSFAHHIGRCMAKLDGRATQLDG